MTTQTTNTDALDLRPLLELREPSDRLVAQVAAAVAPLIEEARTLLDRDAEAHRVVSATLRELSIDDIAAQDGAGHIVCALGIGLTASAVLDVLLELGETLTRNGVTA